MYGYWKPTYFVPHVKIKADLKLIHKNLIYKFKFRT